MTKRRLIKFGLPIAAVLVIVGVALAFWTAAGTGTGTGSSASDAQDVTFSGGTASADLVPGGNGDVSVTVSNPNTFPVHVKSLVLDTSQGTSGFAVDGGHTCSLTSLLTFTATPQDNSGNGWDIPAKVSGTNGSLPIDLSNAVSMSSSAEQGCQGADFTVYLKAGS